MSKLYDLFAREKAREKAAFSKLRKESEAKIVRWKYWDSPNWYWDPSDTLYYDCDPETATKADASTHYGYDSLGHVVLIRSSVLPKPDDECTFYFLRHTRDSILIYHFIGIDALYSVIEARVKNGQIVHLEQAGCGDWDTKDIEWKDGRVFKATTRREYERGNIAVVEATYDPKGNVIAEVDRSKIKETPLPKGVTLKSLEAEIRPRLIQAIVKTITKLKLKKPVYCLALNYDCEGNPIMPPMLGIGLESERIARLKKGGKDAKFDIWEPEQMSLFGKEETDEVIFEDKKLEKSCDYYNRLLDKKDDNAPAKKLLNEVAAELCRMDWTGKLTPTQDFVAYAVDTEMVDLKKNLQHSVSPERLKKLKAAKMI